MLDIKLIREDLDKVKKGVKDRGVDIDIDKIISLDNDRRKLIQEIESLKAEKNKISKQKTRNKKQEKKAKELKNKIKKLEPELEKIEKEFKELMFQVPNLPSNDVPIGKDEKSNLVVRNVGLRTKFSFEPKDYLEIAEKLDIIDIKRAAKVFGSRFGYLKGGAALLEFGLINLTLDVLTNQGFIPVVPPIMIKSKMAKGMGHLEQLGEEEAYFLPKDDLYLAGTAEHSIGPMHADEIFQEKELPKRYVAFSSCFRREAGSYGKDTKGIFRVHQFDKVEMFSFCKPENSVKEHKFFLSLEEKLIRLLKIPYRVVQVCTGDLSVPSAGTYDIESWMPGQPSSIGSGQGKYRETHSTSNCTDFQARRLNIRYRSKEGINFVHTINGTAFAIGRMIIAIIENYQTKNGTVEVPKVLQKYIKIREIK